MLLLPPPPPTNAASVPAVCENYVLGPLNKRVAPLSTQEEQQRAQRNEVVEDAGEVPAAVSSPLVECICIICSACIKFRILAKFSVCGLLVY